MRFLAGLIASAFLVASPAAHATELWQGAEAGDSEAEFLARFDKAARPADPDSLDDDTYCNVWIESLEVVGEPFQACFFFTDDQLVQVMLTMKDEPSAREGEAIFDRILEGLRARYGEEDSLKRDGGMLTIHNADWFSDDLEVNLILVYVGDGNAMALNVNYRPRAAVDTNNL